jgi:hypothetical protein
VQPPTPPAEDGSHLAEYWSWWRNARPASVDVETVQVWFMDHLRASPNYWWKFVAAYEYPMRERLPKVTQPLLVLAPHDDMRPMMDEAIALLPPQAEVIELAHMTQVLGVLTDHAEEIAGHLLTFFARVAAVPAA